MNNIDKVVLSIPQTRFTKPRVFLGGTCSSSKDKDYRKTLIPLLKIDYFNPVVDNWTKECKIKEIHEREHCDYVLYVITNDMKGVYSIAEVTDDSNKQPEKVLFCVLEKGFDQGQLNSLQATKELIQGNGGKIFSDLNSVAAWLNHGDLETY